MKQKRKIVPGEHKGTYLFRILQFWEKQPNYLKWHLRTILNVICFKIVSFPCCWFTWEDTWLEDIYFLWIMWTCTRRREYWMIYRGPGFLDVVWFGPPPPSFSGFLCVAGRIYWREEGVGQEPIIWGRESLVVYKSVNTLCTPYLNGGSLVLC